MRWLKLASLVLMALFYIFAGYNHFARPEFYLRMMPPYIPYHDAMVFLSGVAELGLGVALLIAIFPANVHMAVANVPFGDAPSWAAWARLPFQALFIGWAWAAGDWNEDEP